MNYGTMAERVARGIEWLDDVTEDWRDRIDPDKLDLSDTRWCVIAQVSGEYFLEGWESLNGGLGFEYREKHTKLGFDVSENEFLEDSEKYYGELTEAWREALSV